MTPMIDIVFNLLLFFLLSTSYIQHSAMEVQLPKATTATNIENQVVVVELTAKDNIFLDGKEMLPAAAGETGLDTLKAELTKIYTSPDVQRPLLIRADEDAVHGHVVALMDIARELGVKSLNIATLPQEQSR